MSKSQSFHILVDGVPLQCMPRQTVAGALLANRIYAFRSSPNAATPRGAFCMMGACQECAVHIDGVVRRACQTEVAMEMVVELRGAGTAPKDVAELGLDELPRTRADDAGHDHDI
jgi:predicted molibdopterin-dependent oxidoreductase YjgC